MIHLNDCIISQHAALQAVIALSSQAAGNKKTPEYPGFAVVSG
jgi:hypothetical protein